MSEKEEIEEVLVPINSDQAEETSEATDEVAVEAISEEVKIAHKKDGFHLRNLVSTKKRRILVIMAGVLILIAIILAIPFTRYHVLNPFIKKDITLKIIDSKTKKPVTNVSVEVGGISSQTDKDGVAALKSVPVGRYDLNVTKQYYQKYTTTFTVPVITSPQSPTLVIDAVGRQVEVNVTNKISGGPLADVVIEASGTKATTDSKGLATIILPPTSGTIKATLTKDGYNTSNIEMKVDDGIVNSYSATPSGSIYYLSKATGKINVMKSNIDGTNAVVAVAATGQESDSQTSLLSARDWQYSALSATRTDNKQRLYLIDANKNDFQVLDEGNASFTMVGWSGHNFIYTVIRDYSTDNNDRKQLVKSYNAETRKITILDETSAPWSDGYNSAYQQIGTAYIMDNELIYLKSWYGTYPEGDTSKGTTLNSINLTNNSKKLIKAFSSNQVSVKLYEPQGLYVRFYSSGKSTFFEYENGKLKDVSDISDNQFDSFYPTFLISPTGKKTLWYEPRDGKNTVFIGNEDGSDAKTIGSLSEYTPYGWYGQNDEYILLTKNGSELYISPASQVIGENRYQPLKVTDYHKTQTYPGYGYGYGGQ